MKHAFFFVLAVITSELFGQSPKTIELELLKDLKAIEYWSNYRGDDTKIDRYDSLELANTRLKTKLLKYTTGINQTIQYPFQSLQDSGMWIATSGDKKIRIYSWNTRQGGTMQYYDNVYQFTVEKGTKSISLSDKREEDDPGVWFSEIFTLNLESKAVYIGYFHAIYSTKDACQGIKLFSVNNSQLNDTLSLIKTKKGIRNELDFGFDFFSVVDHRERPVKLIFFDTDKRIFKIPVVTEAGKVTTKFIEYHFTGQYFEPLQK